MPQSIFNLYSAAVFADHPLALWNLDDDFSYLSLISASPIWNIVGGSSASVAIGPKTKPGETVGVSDSDIIIETFSTSASVMTMKTQGFSTPANIDTNKKTVCISSFIYPYDNISSYEIGFEYIDPITSLTVRTYQTYTGIAVDEWKKIEHTADAVLNTTMYPYIKIYAASSAKFSLYNFSVGQWSEQYNAETVGSTITPFSSLSASSSIIKSIGINAYSASPSFFKTVSIDAYSLSDQDNGYYIVEGNRMLATNSKLPMVYGSGNITEIYSSNYNGPSIILPGKGFMHETGKYRELTLEFWMRINVKTKTPTRIVGPLSSNDGLYVHDGFLTLKIGPYEQSYFMSKWYRPSLINIAYSPLSATVMINGEDVIAISMNPRDIEFPNSKTFNDNWIGFYATADTQPFEIDCIAIYPYIVPDQLAKRRFVYGQGVGKSDDIIKRFGGNLTNIDFSFSNYTANIKYPDMNQWSGAFYSNVNADSKFLSLPVYEEPEIRYLGDDLSIFTSERLRRTWFGIKSAGTWRRWISTIWKSLALARESDPLYDSLFSQIDSYPVKHITLRPNTAYNNVYGSIVFPSINMINEPVRSIIGIFSISNGELEIALSDPDITEMTLMHFKNRSTGDILKIWLNKNVTVVGSQSLLTLTYQFNNTVLQQFSLPVTDDDLFFIAGIDIDSFNISYANILRNFFSNPSNISFDVAGYQKNMFTGKIFKLTINNGFFTSMDMDNWFNNGIASISNSASTVFNSDIVKYIGNYSMLFKQTNLSMVMDIGSRGYWEDSIPLTSLASYVKDASGNPSIYDLDMMQFNIDYPSNIYITDNVDASDDCVSVFMSLKSYQDVGTVNYSNYTVTQEIGNERIIDFESVANIDITKFRLIDGTVIFAPKTLIDFKDAYVTIHIEIESDGMNTQPVVIKEMSLASLAFDESNLYSINSMTGNKIYPFSRQGSTYATKLKNPFVIYKDSMPYLFLTADSGIYTLPYSNIDDEANPQFSRGVSIPVNAKKATSYNLYGFHLWGCYKNDDIFPTRKKIATLRSNSITLIFYIDAIDNGKRGKISVFRQIPSGEEKYTNILMYQNGILLDSPYLYPMSWSLITFSFPTPLSFNNQIGQIEMHEGMLFNNFAIYEQDIEKKIDDIFESHLGLSNIVAQDESSVMISSQAVELFTDIKWTIFTGKPV